MTNENTLEQRLVKRVKQLEHGETPDDCVKGRDYVKRDIKRAWISKLNAEADLSKPVEQIARRQMGAVNRAKPVGLFFDNANVVALRDKVKARDSAEAKRRSLIQSFWFWGERADVVQRSGKIPRDVAIPEVADVLRTSNLPNPDVDSVEQYVEDIYRWLDEKAESDGADSRSDSRR